MTEQERFREALLYGRPDRIPFSPGWPRESTLKRWQAEGLPPGQDWQQAMWEHLGIEALSATDRIEPGVSFQMMPKFEEKVLAHRDGHYIVRDWMGAVTEISDRFDLTYLREAKDFVTRKWHKFPVENRSDWAEMRKRFDPDSAGRFPLDFEERCRKLQGRDYPLTVYFNGPFWQMREWCGFEGLCILMADDPDLVLEMACFWRDFVLAVLDKILARVVPDSILLSEDMAYKVKSMISPVMAEKFLQPAWQAWSDKVRSGGCRIVEVDSDGYIGELIPLWIESGINVCSPMEVAAGNDLPAYQRKFGRKMAYRGGVDKRAIAAGGKILEQELKRTVVPLLKEGGYIPSCDHGVPPDISWRNFLEYSRMLAGLTGWLD